VNATNPSTVEIDCQSYFAEADIHIAEAEGLIAKGLRDGSTGAETTCRLLLDFLKGARAPLRRLGGLQ
jgi:hypothetical protein